MIGGYYAGDSVVFDGTLDANTPGGIVTLAGSKAQQSYTAINVSNGATVSIPESLQVNGSAIVTVTPNSSLAVSGNLLGTTQNIAIFKPQGTVTLNGAVHRNCPTVARGHERLIWGAGRPASSTTSHSAR